jgi:hypothetical protein
VGRGVTPRGFCIDVKRKSLRGKGFKRALSDTLAKFVPGVRGDVNAAFTYFTIRALGLEVERE